MSPPEDYDQNRKLILFGLFCLIVFAREIAGRRVRAAFSFRGGSSQEDCPVLSRQPKGGPRRSYIDPAQHSPFRYAISHLCTR
jgi:hypothetical protein